MKIVRVKPTKSPNAKNYLLLTSPQKTITKDKKVENTTGKNVKKCNRSKKVKIQEQRKEEQDDFLLFLESEKIKKE